MKKALFGLMLASGLFLSWACNSPIPSSPNGSGTRGSGIPTVTSTPTNLNGYTSTPTATLQPTPPFISGWGVNFPTGLAEGNGYIYVAQGDNGASVSQVELFANPGGGTAAATWTGYGSTAFQMPDGVAVSPTSSNVYVLDEGINFGGAVYEFSTSATPSQVTSWLGYNGTDFTDPMGIALDASGNVYVADNGNGVNGQIDEFTSGGTTIGSWDNNGTAFAPAAVAVAQSGSNAGSIYAVDTSNNAGNFVVRILSSITGTATTWSLYYKGNPDYPYYALTVDSTGNVYVADYFNYAVEVYSGSGSLIGLMDGSAGGSSTPFTGPDALLLYGVDIYVGDYDNSNVQIFGPNSY